MLVKGMASGNLVEAHIMVKRYWFLDLFFGKGPTVNYHFAKFLSLDFEFAYCYCLVAP